MDSEPTQVVRTLVSEEIRRIVAEAVGDGMCVSARASAVRIMRTYPNSGMSEDEIVGEIGSAAAAAGVVLEDGHPGDGADHAGATPFGVLFAQSEALYETLDGMVSGADGPIDPAVIASRLIEENPGLEFSEMDVEDTVKSVARFAAKPVKSME